MINCNEILRFSARTEIVSGRIFGESRRRDPETSASAADRSGLTDGGVAGAVLVAVGKGVEPVRLN